MTIPVHTLGDYLDLLAEQNLLAAPIPDGLDRSQRVTGLTCDSRQVAPGTLFIRKGAHFQTKFLEMARDQGAMPASARRRTPSPACPASPLPTPERCWPRWPTASTTTPPAR